MMQRLPFYMVYNSDDLLKDKNVGNVRIPWSEEAISRRDYHYMKSAYPNTAKRILPYVEEECDRMEYSGSMMFDEYPDQLQIRMMCGRISRKFRDDDHTIEDVKWLNDFIEVICWVHCYYIW